MKQLPTPPRYIINIFLIGQLNLNFEYIEKYENEFRYRGKLLFIAQQYDPKKQNIKYAEGNRNRFVSKVSKRVKNEININLRI